MNINNMSEKWLSVTSGQADSGHDPPGKLYFALGQGCCSAMAVGIICVTEITRGSESQIPPYRPLPYIGGSADFSPGFCFTRLHTRLCTCLWRLLLLLLDFQRSCFVFINIEHSWMLAALYMPRPSREHLATDSARAKRPSPSVPVSPVARLA